jgi:hypothetical protein
MLAQPPGLGLNVRIDLGEQPHETMARILEVVAAWIPIAERVWRDHGLWASEEEYPPPEELEPLLPPWFVDALNAQLRDDVAASDWRLGYRAWLHAMENRCWQWWSHRQDGRLVTVAIVVDGFPCPVRELVCLARLAGAAAVEIEW